MLNPETQPSWPPLLGKAGDAYVFRMRYRQMFMRPYEFGTPCASLFARCTPRQRRPLGDWLGSRPGMVAKIVASLPYTTVDREGRRREPKAAIRRRRAEREAHVRFPLQSLGGTARRYPGDTAFGPADCIALT